MRHIRYAIFVICAIFSLVTFAKQQSEGSDKIGQIASSPKKHLQSLLCALKTYSAHYIEYSVEKGQRSQVVGSGVVYAQSPNKLRWVSYTPHAQHIISDGKNLWHYDLALDQAVKQPLHTIESTGSPITLFIPNRIAATLAHYRVTTYQEKNIQYFTLRPLTDDKNTVYSALTVGFQNKAIRAFYITGPLGKKNVFIFKDRHINSSLSRALFQFTPKYSTDILS